MAMSTRHPGRSASPQPASRTNRRRGRGTIIAVVAALVVVLLVIAAAVGEFYLRNRITSCLEGQLASQVGSPVTVELGTRPILLTALDDKVDSVTMRNQDGVFGNARGMDVEATVHDVVTDGTAATEVGSSEAHVVWSADGIRQTLTDGGIGPLLSDVRTDPGSGTIAVVFGALAELTIRPEIVGDRIEFTTVDASLLGLGIPTDLADSVVSMLTAGLQVYPLGMTPQSVEVGDNGVNVTLTGGEYSLTAPADAQALGSIPASC